MRGNKVCETCKGNNGPRAFKCRHCSAIFKIKGVLVTPEQLKIVEDRKAGISKTKPDEDDLGEFFEVEDFFVKDEPTDVELKNGGKNTRCYLTPDHKFRLRYAEEFMGVSIDKLHEKRYTLLVRNSDRSSSVSWWLVKRFKRLQRALRYFKKVVVDQEQPLVIYKPGDDDKRSHRAARLAKRERRIKRTR